MSGRPGTGPAGQAPAPSGPGAPVFRPGAGGSGAGGPGGRPMGPGGGRGPGMMGMGMGMPPAKAKDFRGSLRRLFGTLRPERPLIVVVVLLAIVSVSFNVIGPKILGEAVNRIVEGALGKQVLASGATQEQVIFNPILSPDGELVVNTYIPAQDSPLSCNAATSGTGSRS